MFEHLLHHVPVAMSVAALLAAAVVLQFGRRIGGRGVRHALAPALFLGAHGLVGVTMFAGRELGAPREQIGTIAATLDIMSVALLVWMLVDAWSAIASVRAELGASRIREREYERARLDYERLMRHRIANPLQVVSGGITTLTELDDVLSDADRVMLLAAMAEAAQQVEHVALAPDPISVEERGLAGRPQPELLAPRRTPRAALA